MEWDFGSLSLGNGCIDFENTSFLFFYACLRRVFCYIKLPYLGIVIQDFFNKMADAQTHVLVCTTLPAVAHERYHTTALADFKPARTFPPHTC